MSNDKTAQLRKMALNIETFGRVVNPTMFTIPSAPFHKELYDILKDKTKEYICLKAPRGSAKSSIVVKLVILGI